MEEEHISSNPLVNRFNAQRGSIDEFLKKIPIIGEAFENSEYASADQFIRGEVQKQFREAKGNVQKLSEKLLQKGKTSLLGVLENLQDKLNYTINKIASSNVGTSGFGSGLKPTKDQLDEIVNYDQTLYEKANTIIEEIKSIKGWTEESGPLDERVEQLIEFLEGFEEDFKKREGAVGSIKAQG